MLTLTFTPEFKPRPDGRIALEPEVDFPITIGVDYKFKSDEGFDVVAHVEWLEEHLLGLYGGPASGFQLSGETKKEWVRQIYEDAEKECLEAGEDGPYSKEAIDLIRRLKPVIIKYAKKVNVNPKAIAGAIADEYSRYDFFDKNIQDKLLASLLEESFVRTKENAKIIKALPLMNYILPELPRRLKYTIRKLIDVTSHDFGKGNIRLETAMNMQAAYPQEFPDGPKNHTEMASYLTTDEGMVHLASLVIKHAKEELREAIEHFSDDERIYVSFLITAYKQGYYFINKVKEKYKEMKARKATDIYKPGEGVLVICKWTIISEIFD